MKNINKEDIGMALLIGTVLISVMALLYGILIYNHSQNIKRDEFFATHCKTVTTSTNINNGTVYSCGSLK